jgi:DinB superfamily
MRRYAIAILFVFLIAVPLRAEPIKPGDRQRLLAHLEMTERWLLRELDGLSVDQLKFQMTPDSWSIMDVVEHLAIAEPQYWKQLQDSLKSPAGEIKPEATDAGILWYGIDRTNRTRTGEARVPKGRFETIDASVAEFRKLRATMGDFAKTTQEDLRRRMLLEGNIDVYQWYLMISTHSQRHLLQIQEIKAHAGYPKK